MDLSSSNSNSSSSVKKEEPASPPPKSQVQKKSKLANRTKPQKGLRHFSLKVCEKVEQQKVTTYNKVADDLVHELTNPATAGIGNKKAYDEKNIRRRVYDALNVLMAMGIITKEKKKITWIGLPGGLQAVNSSADMRQLQRERTARAESLSAKKQALSDLLVHQVCFKNLVARNSASQEQQGNGGPPAANRLVAPFVIVATTPDTILNCEMSADKTHVNFDFTAPFAIHEDKEVMKLMQLGHVAPWDLPRLIPRELAGHYPSQFVSSPPALAPPQ
jgi:transcription factor Dp-1